MCAGQVSEEQLRRQRSWLGGSWIWLLENKVLPDYHARVRKPTALDVGCGPGLVMELLSPLLDVQGIDIVMNEARACRKRGLDSIAGMAEALPFKDNSFDIVYCSYLLLWVDEPEVVIKEMARVAKDWIICLAEPDPKGRIGYPPELSVLDEVVASRLREEGADPMMGRQLPGLFARCGLASEAGTYSGTWTAQRMKMEAEEEWRSMVSFIDQGMDYDTRSVIKIAWDRAAEDGSLVQHNPVFYALARKAV